MSTLRVDDVLTFSHVSTIIERSATVTLPQQDSHYGAGLDMRGRDHHNLK